MSKTKSITVSHASNFSTRLRIVLEGHTPSWKKPSGSSGGANIDLDVGNYSSGLALCIDAEEWSQNEEGRQTSKRVMMSLDDKATRALFDVLTVYLNRQVQS